MQITKEIKENAEVVLKGTLTVSQVENFYKKAIDEAIKQVSLPGFRKGHVPREKVIEEVGESFLWKDAAERALREELDEILKQEEVTPIIPLNITLSPKASKEEVSFEIVVVVPPTCTIDNYKKVSEDALKLLPKEDVAQEEEQAKQAFRTQIRAISQMSKPEEIKEGDAKENEEKADEALTDEEAKLVGFENATAVEHFLVGEAQKAVADKLQQKKRATVAEALIGAATRSVPLALIDEEAHALLETFKKDVAGQNIQWGDYLKRVGKSETQILEDLKPQAEKRITLDLVFGHIVRTEKLELSEEDKKKEEEFAHKIVEQGVDHQRAHAYAHEQFLREKVWEVLGIKNEPA